MAPWSRRSRARWTSLIGVATVLTALVVATPAYAADDFQVTVQPSSRQLTRGVPATFQVSVGRIGAFTSPVTLSIGPLPTGVTARFSTNPVTPPGTSTLTVTANNTALEGSSAIPVRGTAGGVTHLATFALSANFALQPVPPPCLISIEGTVTDAAPPHPSLVGAIVSAGPRTTTSDASGHYLLSQVQTFGGPAFVSASFEPNYFGQLRTVQAPCGGLARADFALSRKMFFDISARVFEGVANASNNWVASKRAPETPVAGANVSAWTSCDFFGSDLQSVRTVANGVSQQAMRFPLGPPDNSAVFVSSYASIPESATPPNCYPPAIGRNIGGYWWSSASPFRGGQSPAEDIASTSNLHISRDFLVVPKCATSISGKVVYDDTGLPARGVGVNANNRGTSVQDAWDAESDAGTRIVTDNNGNFQFPSRSLRLWYNNQPTTYRVFSTAVPDPDHQGWSGSKLIDLAGNCANAPTVEIRLQGGAPPIPPGAIDGHVYDEETGRPVAGKTVCVNNSAPCSRTPTDASGHYRIPKVPVISLDTPSVYSVVAIPSASDPDYWSSSPAFNVSAAVRSGQTTFGIDLKILRKRFGAVAGVVTDPTNNNAPVPTARVQVAGCPTSPQYCVTTYDGRGGYRIDHIELGYRNAPVGLTIQAFADQFVIHDGTPLATYRVTVSADRTTIQNAQLERLVECDTTATISGRVTNLVNGSPIAGATVEHRGLDGSVRQAITNAQGNYVLTGVPVRTSHPAQAQLTASARDYFPQTMFVTLACGAVIDILGPPADTNGPTCLVERRGTQTQVTFEDNESGLQAAGVVPAPGSEDPATGLRNATAEPNFFFLSDPTDPFTITLKRVNAAQPGYARLRALDSASPPHTKYCTISGWVAT